MGSMWNCPQIVHLLLDVFFFPTAVTLWFRLMQGAWGLPQDVRSNLLFLFLPLGLSPRAAGTIPP